METPENENAPLFKKRNTKNRAIRKRPTTPVEVDSDSAYSSVDEDGRRVKRRRKVGGVIVSSTRAPNSNQDFSTSKFSADKSAYIEANSDATKQSNWYDEKSKEKSLLGSTRLMPQKDARDPNDEVYRGTTNYSSFIKQNPNASAKKIGPLKAPTNVRTITITDYNPEVCKDYKQTGWCGFGDSCKFLHSREDYKFGFQLDQEWENVAKGKRLEGTIVSRRDKGKGKDNEQDIDLEDEEEAAMLEKIPFACIICKGPYKQPIITKCGHYFCEPCAIKRFKKTPSCAACGAGTGGVFNGAKNLKKLLDRKREKALKRQAEEDKDGEDNEGEETVNNEND